MEAISQQVKGELMTSSSKAPSATVYCATCGAKSGFSVWEKIKEEGKEAEYKETDVPGKFDSSLFPGKVRIVCKHCNHSWPYPRDEPTPPSPALLDKLRQKKR